MHIDSKRRQLLAALAAGVSPGMAWAAADGFCLKHESISDLDAPLTIDTHTHFFNGSDLQVREFLSQTTVGPGSELYSLVNAMGGMLQSLAWHTAPNAQQERAAMATFAARIKHCDASTRLADAAAEALQTAYANGARELRLVAAEFKHTPSAAKILGPTKDAAGIAAAIDALPPTLAEFDSAGKPAVLQTQPTLVGYLRFIFHQFNYRYANAVDYLSTYSPGSTRKVDLAVASLVDYDYWLTMGRPTATSLADQVELLSELSVLLGGRVHGFVPFCPFRESQTLDENGEGDALRLVRHAIENRGFIGVKLYPPMGFAAWGNAGKQVWANKATLNPVAWKADFGGKLDSAMASLFSYCQEHDVPVMAHTNDSNGPYKEFRALAGSAYWDKALQKFPGLSVNFGHFGDSDVEDHQGADTRPFLDLMSPLASSAGLGAYADSGFFAGVMSNQGKMRDTLLSLFAEKNGIMLERLMYGSDWSMILTQKNVKHYLANFIELMARVEEAAPGKVVRQTTLSDAFFGRNAAEFLGLRQNRGNRKRLERFYAANAVAQPDWMTKVAWS